MKRIAFIGVAVLVLLALAVVPASADGPVTKNYGDVALSGGFQSGNFPHIWDLTACDLVLSFTYDANGLVDDFGGGAHAWAELGVRDTSTSSNFNPGAWIRGGKGVWLATDYEWTANTFDPDPPGKPTQDIDDKLILQRGGGADERYYDLPSAPTNPWLNYGIWFDRDGVDQWQATYWGMINGATYNTNGVYRVLITLHGTSATTGTAYMTVNGVQQGFYTTWRNGPPHIYPAGMTFTGDMTRMQVFYGLYGYGATHVVAFKDIAVTGCLYTIPVSTDIKPGSYPNSINLGSKGVVPVAIVTTSEFDASAVNPATVLFAGASPQRWVMEDVDRDGDMDLMLHFRTQDLNLTVSSTATDLTGTAYSWGQPIKGTDTVNIVPRGK